MIGGRGNAAVVEDEADVRTGADELQRDGELFLGDAEVKGQPFTCEFRQIAAKAGRLRKGIRLGVEDSAQALQGGAADRIQMRLKVAFFGARTGNDAKDAVARISRHFAKELSFAAGAGGIDINLHEQSAPNPAVGGGRPVIFEVKGLLQVREVSGRGISESLRIKQVEVGIDASHCRHLFLNFLQQFLERFYPIRVLFGQIHLLVNVGVQII